MSRFNEYARRLDAHAREVFAKREELEAAYNKAERASKEARASGNPIAIARAAADLTEAKNARDSMRRALRDDSGAEIANIRKELAAELDGAFAADPADLLEQPFGRAIQRSVARQGRRFLGFTRRYSALRLVG